MSLRCYSLCKTMYRPTESVDWCQCCTRGVSLPNLEGSANFFGKYDSSQVVDPSYNPCCGARHLRRLSKAFLSCRPRPLAQVAPPATGGAPIAPQLLSYIFLLFAFVGGGASTPRKDIFRKPTNGLSWAPAPTIILQITLLVSVKGRRLYCKIYFFKLL